MMMRQSLTPEWERIDLLGACLSASRRGSEIPTEISQRLEQVQRDVNGLRTQEPWQGISIEFGLDDLDRDILACSLAPQAEPRLAWMYQELQYGIGSPYPTPALIREMFVMNEQESRRFNQRLSQESVLVKSGMMEATLGGPFDPIIPSQTACSELLGWQPPQESIPGAVKIPVNACWDELVLPGHCIQKLKEFILWITHRQKVQQEWGGRVGGGPVALFSGPSGTGKTFASEVIAKELNWPLYRVDLGLLVSKYVGETEKNLNALFDAADNKPVILVFDEADSLFAKRGDVKEARDRYANMEVSHLLSRIERHNGPCILTSNLRQHIDVAFSRRFQMVIDFPRPNNEGRAKLWQLHIPPAAPCDSVIDYAELGNEFNLTGGQIRNAALHAAFLAAGADEPIGLKHIASAVWTEFAKKGGELSTANLGKFAAYLPKEVRS